MAKFFSKTTNGFYDNAINTVIPQDAVAVTDVNYIALMLAQNEGQIIKGDANGNPEAVAAPAPTAAQIAVSDGVAALAAGVNIQSLAMAGLNGTYSLSPNTLLELSGMMAYTEAKNAFPGGATTLTWYDVSGVGHVFQSVPEYQAFAENVCLYVTQIQEYINGGGKDANGNEIALPSNQVVIP